MLKINFNIIINGMYGGKICGFSTYDYFPVKVSTDKSGKQTKYLNIII